MMITPFRPMASTHSESITKPSLVEAELRNRNLHRRRRTRTLLSALTHRCGGVIVRLSGDDSAIGERGARVRGGIDLGICAVRRRAAINVVAHYVGGRIPEQVDAVLCRYAGTRERYG